MVLVVLVVVLVVLDMAFHWVATAFTCSNNIPGTTKTSTRTTKNTTRTIRIELNVGGQINRTVALQLTQ